MLKWLSFLFITLLYTGQVFAVGFEQARLHSHLGEPLNLSVPLVLGASEKTEKTKVMLASIQDYKNLEQMIPKSYGLLRVDINKRAPQKWDVLVSSSQAIDESFLVIVLKVQRGRGNFFKKVQVFLDPISNGPSKKQGVWSNTQSGLEVVSKKQPLQESMQSTQLVREIPVSLVKGWARRYSYGPVQSGDSLSEIAYRLRKDKRWSNREIMLALYDKNPSAFANQSINKLKKGSFLQVPNDEEVRSFVKSQRYQKFKPLLAVSAKQKVAQAVQANIKTDQVVTQALPKQYQGKVSLGLSENLDAPMVNAIMLDKLQKLQKLQKLEPIYQQVMATDLRIDSIGGKVDNLADEVRALRQKVDQLSGIGISKHNNETSYGWLWFIALLMINIVLLLYYLYQKKMRVWQDKLAKSQQKDSFDHSVAQAGHTSMTAPFVDNKYNEDVAPEFDETKLDLDFYPLKEQALSEHFDVDHADSSFVSEQDLGEEAQREEAVNHTVAFEDAVHKQNWTHAQECYDLIDIEDRNQPRIQALYIQKLHGEGSLIERNQTLLKLFKKYRSDQWNRFCSFFDEEIWSQLQEENIINFMGNVIEAEVERVNIMLADQSDVAKNVLDLSEADLTDISVSDFPALKEEHDAEIRPVEKTDSLGSDISNETVVMSADELVKWGKIEEDSSESDSLEVDFEIDLTPQSPEPEVKPIYTKIDLDEDVNFELDFTAIDDDHKESEVNLIDGNKGS